MICVRGKTAGEMWIKSESTKDTTIATKAVESGREKEVNKRVKAKSGDTSKFATESQGGMEGTRHR